MIIRPDMRKYNLFDILIEFKYVNLKDAGLSGEKARELTSKEIKELTPIQHATQEAQQQVNSYKNTLNTRYPELRLKSYVVTALGFERLYWMEVGSGHPV